MASSKTISLPMIRTFCSSTVRNEKMVKAPVQVFGVEGRYASALFSAASKQKQLDAVEKDLDKILKSFSSDKVFREFLLNPIISNKLKSSAIKSVALKQSLATCSTNLLDLLAENGRLKLLPNVVNSFKVLTAATRGEVNVEIVCATELDSTYKQELEGTLQKFAKKGELLLFKYKQDPSIMGGLIVSIGDRYVDMSTASKLKRYTDVLKSTV